MIFSAGPELRDRLKALGSNGHWQDILRDPTSLIVIILDELWLDVNEAWNTLSEVFRRCNQVSSL